MYESFYGFNRRPFSAVPDLNAYFSSRNEEQIRATLTRVLRRAEGPAVIFGGTGFGKTTTALRLAQDISKDFQVVFLQGAQLCSRRALLQSILSKLKLPYREQGEGELRLSLYEHLQPNPRTPSAPLALIVDEADTLPLKLLEELRALSNIVIQGDARVRIVLVGSMRLEHQLANPQLEALNQRLAVRCYLTAWNYDEVHQEVRYQIQAAGAKVDSVCTTDAITSVYRATEGIPRLVHQLLDHALLLGFNYGQKPVSSSLIEEAWADLQQLPCPWTEGTDSGATSSSAIEFGSLDDHAALDSEDEFSAAITKSGNDIPELTSSFPVIANTSAAPVAKPSSPSQIPTPSLNRNVFGEGFEEEIQVVGPSVRSTLSVTDTFVTNTVNTISENLFSQWSDLHEVFPDTPLSQQTSQPIASIFPASEIEEELQEAIGSMNFSSISQEFNIHRLNEIGDDAEFEELFGATNDLNTIGDDRDILIIEDDVDAKKLTKDISASRFQQSQSPSRLFSQLKQF
ncbi:MAG: AAA family ATPase [Planctomycetes bacterium]|nr:AAA family ATPase [Planctomycetota bacterium]